MRCQKLIVELRRGLHPDRKPFSTYIIAAVAREAKSWTEYLVAHWDDAAVRQTALEEIAFYFGVIDYIESRMDKINADAMLSHSQTA